MGNELNKIEHCGSEVAQHSKISREAGQQLQKEVKVNCFIKMSNTQISSLSNNVSLLAVCQTMSAF